MSTLTRLLWNSIASIAIVVLPSACSTVHTDAENSPLVAVWIGADADKHRRARDVLEDHGIEATVDAKGVAINDADSHRAYEALLCDSRLEGSGLMVHAIVEAGTGQRTDKGITARLIPSDGAVHD